MVIDMSADKAEIRRMVRAKREALTGGEVRERSDALIRRLAVTFGVAERRTYALYYPIRNEIDVLPFVRTLLSEGRVAALPRTVPGERRMDFCPIVSLEGLVPSSFGIPEPGPAAPALDPRSIDIIIVPGVAFDRQGRRLGYGGGFYDRYLPLLRRDTLKVALAYDFQLFDELPHDARDYGVDLIISERETVAANGGLSPGAGVKGTGVDGENQRWQTR